MSTISLYSTSNNTHHCTLNWYQTPGNVKTSTTEQSLLHRWDHQVVLVLSWQNLSTSGKMCQFDFYDLWLRNNRVYSEEDVGPGEVQEPLSDFSGLEQLWERERETPETLGTVWHIRGTHWCNLPAVATGAETQTVPTVPGRMQWKNMASGRIQTLQTRTSVTVSLSPTFRTFGSYIRSRSFMMSVLKQWLSLEENRRRVEHVWENLRFLVYSLWSAVLKISLEFFTVMTLWLLGSVGVIVDPAQKGSSICLTM